MQNPGSSPAPRRRRILPITGALVGALMLPAAAAAALGFSAQSTVSSNVQRQNLLPASAVMPQEGVEAGQPIDILFVTEHAPGSNELEAAFVAHISADRQRVDLVHVPRDLVIPSAGQDQLDETYAKGGASQVTASVQSLLGIDIEHVAVTDIEGLRNTVDALGGVTVPGQGKLSGTEALAWIGAEEGQGIREMAVTKAVVTKGLSSGTLMNPKKGLRFLDAATDNVKVDQGLTNNELLQLGLSLRKVRGNDIHSTTVPWTDSTTSGGEHIVLADVAKLKSLAENLKSDSMADYDGDASDNATVVTPR